MSIKKCLFLVFIIVFIALPFSFICLGDSSTNKAYLEKGRDRKEKLAIVSGQSIVGMLAAAVLAKAGYQVDCFEVRDEYTRNIQWAARQSLVDELASIDRELAKAFLQEIATPIYKGSIHVYTNGCRRIKQHDKLGKGDPTRLPSNCVEMMGFPSVAIIEAKVFEKFLKRYLQSLPNVRLHHGTMHLCQNQKGYFVEGYQEAELIVIAEGFNSESRKILQIHPIPVVENKLQIAGTIGLNSGGVMIKHWRKENGKIRLTGIMGGAESNRTWIVADVDSSVVHTQDDIIREFQRLAAEALDMSVQEIGSLKVSGIADDKLIAPFLLKLATCEIATKGDNVVLIGDAVGAGHWCVGGGMQTGAICHIERLKTLIEDMERPMPKITALSKYSEGVLRDTQTWIDVSLKDPTYSSKYAM